MTKLLEIDGATGEGGGQILRTALGLSVATGTPFRIENIRGNRRRPGLMRQHLTAVRAAAKIGGAATRGAELGSRELRFEPSGVYAGEFRFAVGTAGSATLVLQTVLPALLRAQGPSQLRIEGGTHNPMAPPFDFLDAAFLPQLRRMGVAVQAVLVRHGFFPAGGGALDVFVEPCAQLRPLSIVERGAPRFRRAVAKCASVPPHVGERELRSVKRKLGWSGDELVQRTVTDSVGPGNTLTLELAFENVSAMFTAFGEVRLPAEAVADQAIKEAKKYLVSDAPVGPYLADQLLVPIALAGAGGFRTGPLTRHARTNMETIQRFLPVRFEVREEDRQATVEVVA